MLKVGVTGGIGSGKSVVCRVFNTLGIPVFNADDAARHLMASDERLKQAIMAALGTDSYRNGVPDRERIAAIVYADATKLAMLNSLVHPATIQYAARWIKEQTDPYIIKEAAIFFESGSYKEMDVMIGVSAPAHTRINRVMQRSQHSEEKVRSIMAQQMDEAEKMSRCNYIIVNDDVQAMLPQVLRLHEVLLKRARS